MFGDYIEGTDGDDKIYGGSGSDYIVGGFGDDKIYGGSGHDGFSFDVNHGKDVIYSANNDDQLVLEENLVVDIDNFEYNKEKNNLVIETGADSSITLNNYFKGKESKVLDEICDRAGNIIANISSQTINVSGKGKINGTFLNDNIIGSDKKDTINAGSGNDVIYAGAGNDKITGGKGSNVINFLQGDGKDTIYLTKGETLEINYCATSSSVNFDIYEKGNDVIFSCKYITEDGEEKTDSITIKNLGKNNLAESVVCNVCQESDNGWDVVSSLNMTEYIYEREGVAKGKKGATLKGTNLNEYFFGTDNKDTIKTGGGVNIVDAGGGDDYIDSTKGNNTIYIYDGSGNDTILAGANSETHLVFEQNRGLFGFTKKGNDLIITQDGEAPQDLDEELYNTPETVILKNYFKTDSKGNLLNKNVTINDSYYGGYNNREDLLEILQYVNVDVLGEENKANKIDLRKYQDTFDFNVFGGNKNDKIYLGSGNNNVYAGAGNDTIYLGNGNNIIHTGAGNDYVKAGNGPNDFYYTSGNDVYESGVENDRYFVKYSSDMNLTIKDNCGRDELRIVNVESDDLHVFFHINQNGDLIVSDNNSTKLDEYYIFGSDEDGNSMLNYDNIMKGMKGKDMSGVIEIDNFFEKTYDTDDEGIEIITSRGEIEYVYTSDTSFGIDYLGELGYKVGNWLSTYKDGYYESSIDVLSRGSQDDINAMLEVYNSYHITHSTSVAE